jgi:hypothetical protein
MMPPSSPAASPSPSSPPPLLDLGQKHPDLFEGEVLARRDRAVLAQNGWPWQRAVVRAAGPGRRGGALPIAGKSAGVPRMLGEFVGTVQPLAWAQANGCPWEAITCCADALNSVSALRVTLVSSKSRVYLLKDRDQVGQSASRSVGFSKWTVLIGRTGFDTISSLPDPTLSLMSGHMKSMKKVHFLI